MFAIALVFLLHLDWSVNSFAESPYGQFCHRLAPQNVADQLNAL